MRRSRDFRYRFVLHLFAIGKYSVDRSSGVITGPRGWPLKGGSVGTGYLQVVFHHENIRVDILEHIAVALAIFGFYPAPLQVNHINGVKTDNRPSNLELVTPSENQRHSYRAGLQKPKRGEKANGAKLTQVQVDEIKKRLSQGAVQRRLAEEFNVCFQLISQIKLGKIWKCEY